MPKFSGPGTPPPKKRLVAPAAFSRPSAAPLALAESVAASDLAEDAQSRARRLKRPGTVPPAPPRSPSKPLSGADLAGKKASAGKASDKNALGDTPWWVQNSKEIYISEKIRHRQGQRARDAAQDEAVLAHAALVRQREEEAAARRRAHGAADKAASIPMPVKIEKMVVVSKMRDKDIKRDILDVDKKLQAAAAKRMQDKATLRSAVELIKLREEELMLTRERMVHIYRSASETIVRQSQEIGGAEDEDLALFLDKKKKDVTAPLINEMVTHNDMRRASALYAKYSRIEELWAKLREYAFVVGKVGLRRRRAAALTANQQRAQFHQAITESIYNVAPAPADDLDLPPKAVPPSKSATSSAAVRKGSTFGQSVTAPQRKASTVGGPPPASPATPSFRKTAQLVGSPVVSGRTAISSIGESPPAAAPPSTPRASALKKGTAASGPAQSPGPGGASKRPVPPLPPPPPPAV